jgi:phosphatidylinositol 3-kinase
MIHLMDEILKRVNLDLKLTPYRVLATSPTEGFIELVPNSRTLTWYCSHRGRVDTANCVITTDFRSVVA